MHLRIMSSPPQPLLLPKLLELQGVSAFLRHLAPSLL